MHLRGAASRGAAGRRLAAAALAVGAAATARLATGTRTAVNATAQAMLLQLSSQSGGKGCKKDGGCEASRGSVKLRSNES